MRFGFALSLVALTATACAEVPLREAPVASTAVSRRAVVVGIDRYGIDAWPGRDAAPVGRSAAFPDLRGAARDATAMTSLLHGRFGFPREGIVQLQDSRATRQAILDAIERQLVAPARPGDVLVFYFSGHGSEVSRLDGVGKGESPVPADSVVGALDIRDRELAALWSAALARGARLTVIIDACHSGGTTRAGRAKRLPPAVQPFVDVRVDGAPDQSSRALFLLAAEADQDADERPGPPARGAFTLALERALAESPDQSVTGLYARIRAELKGAGFPQDPVVAGARSRRAGLVGDPVAPGPVVFPRVSTRGDEVVLEGGAALGLTVGSRLVAWLDGGRDPTIALEVTDVGVAQAAARVVLGAGERADAARSFVISRFASPSDPLRVFVGDGEHGPKQALRAPLLRRIREQGGTLAGEVDADYVLAARGAGWSWVRRTSERTALLPPETDVVAGSDTRAAEGLAALFGRLARVHGWLTLRSGAGLSGDAFPFVVSFRDVAAPDVPVTRLVGGREYRVALEPTREGALIAGQFVYLFNIDAGGRGTLVFPHPGNGDTRMSCDPAQEGGLCELRFETVAGRNSVSFLSAPDAAMKMCSRGDPGCTFGRELYFLISSEDPITDLDAFSWDAVRANRGACATLDCLLATAGTRGASSAIPPRWSIQRLVLESISQ